MSKVKAVQVGDEDVTAAVEKAVSLAKMRVSDIEGAEVDAVSGGTSVPDIIMGYIMDVVDDFLG